LHKHVPRQPQKVLNFRGSRAQDRIFRYFTIAT